MNFVDVAKQSGLNTQTIYGGVGKNKYLLETTGCGVAFYDYDADGWIDIFLVNGWRLEGFAKGAEPTCHLFKNNRDGTFTDVTAKSGLARSGWGQGCCVGDYDNDGHDDLFVSYYGQCALFHNNGDGTFTDVTAKAGLTQSKTRWNSGLRFSGLRPRWASGPICRELHRSGFKDRAVTRIGSVHLQGDHGCVRTAGPGGREEPPVPQQRRWDVYRCIAKGWHVDRRGELRA